MRHMMVGVAIFATTGVLIGLYLNHKRAGHLALSAFERADLSVSL